MNIGRADKSSLWLVVLATVVLLSSVAALSVAVVRYASSTSAFSLEVERRLPITDLEAAVLVEADIAAKLAGELVEDVVRRC